MERPYTAIGTEQVCELGGAWVFNPISYYNSLVEIHRRARKHGVADGDIEHAIDNGALTTRTTTRGGPARNADLLEVVTIVATMGLAGNSRDEDEAEVSATPTGIDDG